MAEEILFKSWADVPGGSKLLISVSGSEEKKLVTAHLDGIVTTLKGKVETKIVEVLDTVNGTEEEITLKANRNYIIDIVLAFITDAEATVHARVEDSNGNQIGTPLDTVIKRKKAAVEVVTLIVLTKPSAKK